MMQTKRKREKKDAKTRKTCQLWKTMDMKIADVFCLVRF
jgi:hypothetical protein